MDLGKIEYIISRPGSGGKSLVKLRLTLIGQGDDNILREEGLAALRRKRIMRLTGEAENQGFVLGYKDLSGLLFTSLATIKRDVKCLEEQGIRVPIKGRRKNGNGERNSALEGIG
jgi:hypothetical protein